MNKEVNMKTGRAIGRAAMLCLIAAFSIWGIQAFGTETRTEDKTGSSRADIIFIGSMAVLGELERPSVPFKHDQHTTAISEQGKDCTACHIQKENSLSLSFKRIENTDRQTVMDIYHDNCIACHKETAASRNKSGPVECGGCHVEKPAVQSARMPMGLNQSLHFRHSKALNDKCEQCHHEYDETTKKLIYVKEKEGSCRYCHKPVSEKNRISMSLASHAACIDCHLKSTALKKKTGPFTCAGCHDAKSQSLFEKIAPVPRMERKQPDARLIKTGKEALENRMNFVPFDHKAHEAGSDTCRVCHHAGMQNCSTCHTMTGSPEGSKIRLEQAMHHNHSDSSCIGCHAKQQKKRECAGCHGLLTGDKKDEAGCVKCHAPISSGDHSQNTLEEETATAKTFLESRTFITKITDQKDIPEKVTIQRLSQKYQAVEFPHRKIVATLFEEIKDNKLAGYFHSDKATLCQGCHHNSPVSAKPPQCVSCHGEPFADQNVLKPGLLGAYHIQCMECHKKMEIAKPANCTDCHKEK